MNDEVRDCRGCGACCRTQEIPPGYDVLILAGRDAWPRETGDDARLARLPDEARSVLLDALATQGDGGACCWLDEASGRCRWYEYRPQICRDYAVGGDTCLDWRRDFGIDEVVMQNAE